MDFAEEFKNINVVFNPNEFMKESFSVDCFLSTIKCCELEKVREDLGLLLQLLKRSMIKLINADYQDFILLSTNLKDLKTTVKNLEVPFFLLKTKIDNMKNIMKQHIEFIEKLISERCMLKILRKKLFSLQNLKNYTNYFKEINEIDRFSRFLHLMYLSKHKINDFDDWEHNKEIALVNNSVKEKLESRFYDCVKQNQQQDLYKILLTCSVIDNISLVENVFRKKIVKQFVEEEVSSLIENKISKQSLSNFYKNVLDFIPIHMKNLLFLTIYNKRIEETDFLINSLWTEIEEQLRDNLPLIFSPGNPELFISRLESTEIFLNKFEKLFGNKECVIKFRSNQNTKNFLQCWNLTVYFQIRFQEILYDLEAVAETSQTDYENNTGASEFKLTFTEKANKAINKCWSNGIYNKKLFTKFLKLSLQILSRVNIWARNILDSNKSKNFPIDLIVLIYGDISLITEKIPIYTQVSKSKLPKEISNSAYLCESCFEHSTTMFKNLKNLIEEKVAAFLINQSSVHLKFVADLTRMYRKTNRDVPNDKSIYVHNMTKPFESFKQKYSKSFTDKKLKEIFKTCFQEITKDYFNCVSDILLSIKRTEESLKRLKNIRSKTMNSTDSVQETTFVGDDDKIRIQLRIDVLYWVASIQKAIGKEDVPNLQEFIALVEIPSLVTANI
ncbi:conserved oligomeric Golgi complex subunit 2 [Condylostylus longicornis]|uniref:conserved oligomeric Golgi complex subunit 2 n=1 Tax=Condylostylus longicornis TaxID=2530218 RepID=UPI00244E0DAF|nr:conserved oligomeric Golgi complex subunit 2 [Condylostylus longicornis]